MADSSVYGWIKEQVLWEAGHDAIGVPKFRDVKEMEEAVLIKAPLKRVWFTLEAMVW